MVICFEPTGFDPKISPFEMETLVAVSHHRSQYCNRSKSRNNDHFGSSPPKGFRGINCRTFHSDVAILSSSPSKGVTFNGYPEPKSHVCYSEPPKRRSKSIFINGPLNPKGSQEPRSPDCWVEPPFKTRSKPIPITAPSIRRGATLAVDLDYSELWAGPAFSNSPPPSSLPIPRFSVRQKRSSSLDLPVTGSEVSFQPLSKSAPSSPTRESTSSNNFIINNATATENLRRILHLDITVD